MIDSKLLLQDFDFVAERLRIKQVSREVLEDLQSAVLAYKKAKLDLEELQAFQNKHSKLFAQYKQEGKDTTSLQQELEHNKQNRMLVQLNVDEIEANLFELLSLVPNLPDTATPEGVDENDNVVIKEVLERPSFAFAPKEHWELAEQNGWIDFEAGVKLAKSRFSVLRGEAARLHFALIRLMLDHNQQAGFELAVTPAIVNAQMLFGTGQLPKFENDMFRITSPLDEEDWKNELYLISTSEITLTNLYNDTIIPADSLPIMLTTQTPCFRKEAGSAGRDTRGMIRQHQFDKVELVAITKPEESAAMHQKMIETASALLCKLGLAHRLVQLCGGDLGFSASNTVDIEVWLPGQNKYREISSISNTQDFQARRAKIRYKEQGKNRLAHTLNGSSLAVGRTLVAIMENYQQSDGSIRIPQILESYL
ncbi:MAG: serine--tRNA ligase [Helicobacter sp.]|nr:serine--tRNA ligase [Helicobacter sp.]